MFLPLVIGVKSFENSSTTLPFDVVTLLCDDIFPRSSLNLIILFSIRLVDSFKLHEQLNVPVQKLTAGASRKVCMGCDIILRADTVVVANRAVSLHCSYVLC